MTLHVNVEIKKLLDDGSNFVNTQIRVCGWVRTSRLSKEFGFIELNDGSCFRSLQIVFDSAIANWEQVIKINVGFALIIEGLLVESPGANQQYELKAEAIIIENVCPSEYPLQKKRHSLEYLRTISHLRPRTNTFMAVFRLRSVMAYAVHKYFQENGFVNIHTPIITGSDAEGAGEMFRVTTLNFENILKDEKNRVDFSKDFFGKETNLTVSGQLNAECFALAFRKVYTFGPTFRAENSNTARHAAEFWMIEPEIAFAGLDEDMDLAEDMVKYLINYALDNCPEEMAFFNSFIDKTLFLRLQNILDNRFIRISYDEAITELTKAKVDFSYPVKWGLDLQTEHERYITEKVFGKPVFITDYPKDIKAFYMRANDDGRTVAATDLLVPGVGEIIGGSQREERLHILEDRLLELKMNKENYWWYLDLRKYGGVKHSGFGLGFERLLMYLSGITNIRDVIPFPRTVKSADF